MRCLKCKKTPDEIPEYHVASDYKLSREEYVRLYDFTYRKREDGVEVFICSGCWINLGAPLHYPEWDDL